MVGHRWDMRASWVEGGRDKTATRRDETLMNKHSRHIRMVLNTSSMFPVWSSQNYAVHQKCGVVNVTLLFFCWHGDWAVQHMQMQKYFTADGCMDACVTCVTVGGYLTEHLITIGLVVMTDFVDSFFNCFLSPSHYYVQNHLNSRAVQINGNPDILSNNYNFFPLTLFCKWINAFIFAFQF